MRIIGLLQKITLLEMYFLLNQILEVSSDDDECLKVNLEDIKSRDFTCPPLDKPEACDRCEDQGLYVQTVQIYNKEDGKCQRNLNLSNPSDNHFMQTLRKACSGRDRCYFVSGLRLVLPKFTCGSKLADSFKLSYVCKSLEPDGNRVFDIKTGFMKAITVPGTNKYYLVLGENETIEHSRCEMSGHNVQLYVTLLQADFKSIQKFTGKSCLGNQEVNIDWNSQTHSSQQVCLSRGTFELSMVTGLVWIEISGSQSFKVSCNTSIDSASGSSTKTATLSSSASTATLSSFTTTTTLSTASTTANLSSSNTTTTLSTASTTANLSSSNTTTTLSTASTTANLSSSNTTTTLSTASTTANLSSSNTTTTIRSSNTATALSSSPTTTTLSAASTITYLGSSTTTTTMRSSNTATALSSSPTTTTLSSASSPGDTNNSSTSGTKGTKERSYLIQVTVPMSVVLILVVLIAVILAVICVRNRKRKRSENLHQHELLNKSVVGHEYVTMDTDSKTSLTAETTTSQRPSAVPSGGRLTSATRMEASAQPFLSPETSDRRPQDERVQATYATVNKVRNSGAVSAAARSPGTTDGTTMERGPADSAHGPNEYSHLARCRKEERVTENHYDG